MAKYQISWLEAKTTSTGKNKYDLTIKGEDGTTVEGITMWDSFPGFTDFRPGSSIEGDIVTKVNGQYTNKTLYPVKPKVASGGQLGGFKGNMTKVMEKKQEGIQKSQDNKERGIILSSTARDATLFVTTFYRDQNLTELELRNKWTEWRAWFAKNWGEDLSDITTPF